MLTTHVLGTFMAILGVLFIAVQVLFIRIGSTEGGTQKAFNAVMLINTMALLPIALIWHYPDYGITPFALFCFATSGVVGNLLGRLCYYHSISVNGASRTEPIKASNPLVGVVLAMIILGESMTLLEGAGTLFLAVGAVLTSWEMASDSNDATVDFSWVGLVFPVGAAFFYGVEPIFIKWGFAEGTPLLVALCIKLVVALVLFWVYLGWNGEFVDSLNIFTWEGRWYLIAGLANTLFLFFYFGALEISPVVLVLPVVQTSPIAVALLSLFFLSDLEEVTWPLIIACLTVVVGAILLSV